MPLVGRDWSHTGVATLYSNIKANGYHILYLTSRAIGQVGAGASVTWCTARLSVHLLSEKRLLQANITRGYISSVKQGEDRLPEVRRSGSIESASSYISQGPVIMSPDRLFMSFKREVVYRRPQVGVATRTHGSAWGCTICHRSSR